MRVATGTPSDSVPPRRARHRSRRRVADRAPLPCGGIFDAAGKLWVNDSAAPVQRPRSRDFEQVNEDREAPRTASTATRADARLVREGSRRSAMRMRSKTSNASFRRCDPHRMMLELRSAGRNPTSFHPAERSHLFGANVPPRLRHREFCEHISKRVQADGIFEFPNVCDL